VRRLGRFLVRNWPLKIGAILLAVILYAGMVILQSTAVWPGTVAIVPVNQPPESYLVGALPEVGGIRYVASPDVAVTVHSFRATIDLANVSPSESDQSLVSVSLTAEDARIQIIDYQPQQIRVTLDKIVTKQVPVVVKTSAPPSGIEPGPPVADPSTVKVTGASTYVKTVAYAEAQVRIDASGLDVNQDVDLVARDTAGNLVSNVTFEPRSAHVTIQVGSQLRTQTVPVHPVVVDSPAAGYYISSVDVTPSVVEVEGQADALALLKGMADTKPISIAGATGDTVFKVSLDLPQGVTAANATEINVVIHLATPSSSRTYTVGVSPTGADPHLSYSLSTPSVLVTVGGATAALNALDPSSLVADVSVSGLGPGTYTLTVSVPVPAGIRVTSLSPFQVIVTITSPPSPSPLPSPSP
jgi:YbbR domain-containing protein